MSERAVGDEEEEELEEDSSVSVEEGEEEGVTIEMTVDLAFVVGAEEAGREEGATDEGEEEAEGCETGATELDELGV